MTGAGEAQLPRLLYPVLVKYFSIPTILAISSAEYLSFSLPCVGVAFSGCSGCDVVFFDGPGGNI